VGVSSANVVSTNSVTTFINGVSTTQVILDSAPAGFSGCNVTVTLSDPSVVVLTGITLPTWATVSDTSTLPSDTVSFIEADTGNAVAAGATNILLASITMKGLSVGTSILTVTVNECDNEIGGAMAPSSTSGTATVTSTAYPIRPSAAATISPVDTSAYVAIGGAFGGNHTPANETDAAINFSAIVDGGMMPYTNIMGVFAWFILLAIPFTMLWIVQGKAWIPLVLGIMLETTALVMGYIPAEYTSVIMVSIALSVLAIIYSLLRGDR
jgi:hypothetical protein